MISDTYIAGFFDGEGSIGIYRNGQGNFHLRTQLTQNVLPSTEELLVELRNRFGGNLSRMKSPIYRRNEAFNWQNNGFGAANFLGQMLPYLRIKRDQAELAIVWQSSRPKACRDARGRMMAARREHHLDIQAEQLMKALKSSSLLELMAAQSDLVDIVHTLKQLVCIKG